MYQGPVTLRTTQILAAAVAAIVLALPLHAQEQEGATGLAAETGRITGTVINSGTGDPVPSAQVTVAGTQIGVLSSVQGRYLLQTVPTGTQTVEVTHLGHGRKSVTGVSVRAGETVELNISLDPQAVSVAGIEVTAAIERGNTVALLNERQLAPGSLDAIGREQISRSTDGNAAEALKRVPGLSVVDGRFAFIRGLGERYSSTSLNGAPLASPVPDKNVIPLDMFPAELLESVVTLKTYSPDKPGDYAGGHVQLRTRAFPSRREIKVSASTGYHSGSTFDEGLGYRGGRWDFLGFDDGTRGLPDAVPSDTRVQFGSNFSREQIEDIGESFDGDWGPSSRRFNPPRSISASLGNSSQLFDRRLGYVASLNWSDQSTVRGDLIERVFAASGLSEPEIDYTGQSSTRNVMLGGLFNAAYELGTGTEVRTNLIYSRLTEDQARVYEGFNLDSNTNQRNSRIQFLAQSMFNAQMEGTHLLSSVGNTVLEWRAGHTRAKRLEPNTREVLYRQTEDGAFLFDTFIQSGSVFHQDLDDIGWSGELTVEVPFEMVGRGGTLKFGTSREDKDREVYTRRFRFLPAPGGVITDSIRALDPNDLLAPEHIGQDGFEVQEATFRPDNYTATDLREAGFIMVDLRPFERIRLVGGARVERALQEIAPFELGTSNPTPVEGAELSTTDVLPAVNVTLEATDRFNLRMGVFRTLARPQLRELAPFGFADYAGGYLVIGNPNLGRTQIDHLDLRAEWFFAPGSVLSASAFLKRFDDPIETVVLPSSELAKSWVNADDAENRGIELELRSTLGVVSETLRSLALNANLTLVESTVTTGDSAQVYVPGLGSTRIAVASKERGLQGQSPYVANLGLSWDPSQSTSASLQFNRFGRRIDAVGGQGSGDQFEEARSQLDLSVQQRFGESFEAKISASRLLGNVVTFEQEGDVLRQYDMGRSVSLSFSWEL